ncbi:LacI family DNA-binding transcriptional regulator [Rhizorhabdus dicambivorans]|uniref:LacI family transcriptional regulator n=1 Tax=Rhizorhabdus dicambivorans TaxID=1850238 RepID=A0A2A4G3E5_9SPHN|nr:LacI family DNA-binding transcriptional regulator [Rhizorhabdus dicambivorans]ATE65056.1 LacI family transcriptional regulator [Rhizorhabdus dicambivorans]PCE44330.1 LacI family transcriptional regulator [Rhizorhabdus dicambivorans]
MPVKGKGEVNSISDIARLAGVSASTVSRALAGSKMISTDTRNRINDLAREHGFQLNQMARNLRLKRTNAIGIIFPLGHEVGQLVSDPFFITMLGHIADGVTARGYDLLLTRIIPDDDGWLDGLVNSGRVDGLIVIGQSDQEAVLRRVSAGFDPIVVWGEKGDGQGYCSVGTDNVAGGAVATRHLLGQGRRHILYAGHADVPEIVARHAGFVAAHREAGVEPAGVIPAPFTPDGAYRLFVDHLAAAPKLDGIVAASDVIAIAAIRALAEHGMSVPDDVAVVGYDDVPLASQMAPSLTTIRQDLREGANQLVDRLFRRLGGDLCEPVVMAPELIVRASAP